MYFLSSGKSDSLNDEYDDDGSESGYSSTCSFPLQFYDSIGRVSGLGSGLLISTGVKYKCDVFVFVVFVPIGVESKGGQLVKKFWRSNSLFPLQISK